MTDIWTPGDPYLDSDEHWARIDLAGLSTKPNYDPWASAPKENAMGTTENAKIDAVVRETDALVEEAAALRADTREARGLAESLGRIEGRLDGWLAAQQARPALAAQHGELGHDERTGGGFWSALRDVVIGLAFALVILVALVVLAGCGDAKSGPQQCEERMLRDLRSVGRVDESAPECRGLSAAQLSDVEIRVLAAAND